MIRKGLLMAVNPDRHEEYRQRHDPVWPELESVLMEHGVHRYSIFLHAETSQLFAYVEIEDEARWEAIANTGVCQEWWAQMHEIMPSNPDHSPRSDNLEEVYCLQEPLGRS